MAIINSRDGLIDYAYRRLGEPVIDINVDRQQAEERLDDALQFFTERHFDGVERALFTYPVTQSDIDNGFVDMDGLGAVNGASGATASTAPTGKDVVSVVKVFRFGSGNTNMFDVRYQMALSDYFGINRGLGYASSMGIARYDSTKRYINMIQDFFQPEKRIRFNKVSNKIHLDYSQEDMSVDDYLILETYVKIPSTAFSEIFNDVWLKKYATALIKKQWGSNMSKFEGIQMPGGVSLRGGEISAEANEEIQRLEEQLQTTYELPIDFNVG